MEPKTKIQKQVVELSTKLPAITEKQKAYAFSKCFDNYAVRSRNTLFCLECGHSWKDASVLSSTLLGCSCPKCGNNLKMYNNYSAYNKVNEYFAIISTVSDMQVVRMFFVTKKLKKNNERSFDIDEVMQHWITPSGKVTTMSKKIMGLSNCYDQWIFDTILEVRQGSSESCQRYNLNPYKIWPDRKILPVIKRNGFKGQFYGNTPHGLFALILRDKIAETLLKTGQVDILKRYNSLTFEKYWPSVKICIRNGYIIKDASMWCDHIDLLKYFGKDLRNAKFVCPVNLQSDHQHLIEKKRIIRQREKLEEQKKEIAKAEKKFRKEKGMYLDIRFTDGIIDVMVLDSVNEFLKEGDELHHCVYSNEYYSKKDSLILSARKSGKRLETIEVSLKKMDVVQSRGLLNKSTEYHDQIIGLVKRNISLIQSVAV